MRKSLLQGNKRCLRPPTGSTDGAVRAQKLWRWELRQNILRWLNGVGLLPYFRSMRGLKKRLLLSSERG